MKHKQWTHWIYIAHSVRNVNICWRYLLIVQCKQKPITQNMIHRMAFTRIFATSTFSIRSSELNRLTRPSWSRKYLCRMCRMQRVKVSHLLSLVVSSHLSHAYRQQSERNSRTIDIHMHTLSNGIRKRS